MDQGQYEQLRSDLKFLEHPDSLFETVIDDQGKQIGHFMRKLQNQ
jgi:hypothetical protein